MAKLGSLIKNEQFIKTMVYGASGVGKTTFACQFPGPIFVADFDGKVNSAARYLEVNDPSKLDQIEVENYQTSSTNGGSKAFDLFERKLAEFEKQIQEGKFLYKTVVIDSLTSFSDIMMMNIVRSNPSIKRVKDGLPALQDYLILNNDFKAILYRILALPCNVIIVGHVQQDKDETTGRIVYRPALSGKLPEILPILFEEVWFASTATKDNKLVRIAQTQPLNGYVARTQIQNMPPIIELSYKFVNDVLTKQNKKEVSK